MRTLATLATLLLGLAIVFWAPAANAAMCPDGSYVSGSICTLCPNGSYVGGGRCVLQPDGTYTGGYGGSPAPGSTFNVYPALQLRAPDVWGAFQRGQRDAEALRTQRLQNQLLQQQLQQQQQQFQATQPGVLKGDPLNADEAFIQATAAPIGKTIAWNNPNTGRYGTVTPVREGTKASTGEYCREFRRTIGGTKQGYAVACRQGGGVWRIK